MIQNKQSAKDVAINLGKQRSYNEIIELLEKSWNIEPDKSLKRIEKLNVALKSPSKKLNTIFVSGSNGKSLTVNFVNQILKEEGFKVGSFYSPHILTYNERIALENESLPNKLFTEVANEVLNAAESLNSKFHTLELLTMMALVCFEKNKVDVAVLELNNDDVTDPVNVCKPLILAITRITSDMEKINSEEIKNRISAITDITKKDTYVVSADQSKINLQIMQDLVTEKSGNWMMPIRKLAPLAYPFEQLHGRCASLAERIAQIYVENFTSKEATILNSSLLVKPESQRGRPTLEKKRELELNPRRTLEQFWKDISTTLTGQFQILDKEKPSILLDVASNIDSLSNIFLGVRLLNYKRPFKGLSVIVGCQDSNFNDNPDFIKMVRYFFKKNSGQIIFSPVNKDSKFDLEKVTNDLKNAKIKAKSAKNFAEAFEQAKQSVDERNGLILITGSPAIVSEYWNYKGIKKL